MEELKISKSFTVKKNDIVRVNSYGVKGLAKVVDIWTASDGNPLIDCVFCDKAGVEVKTAVTIIRVAPKFISKRRKMRTRNIDIAPMRDNRMAPFLRRGEKPQDNNAKESF